MVPGRATEAARGRERAGDLLEAAVGRGFPQADSRTEGHRRDVVRPYDRNGGERLPRQERRETDVAEDGAGISREPATEHGNTEENHLGPPARTQRLPDALPIG